MEIINLGVFAHADAGKTTTVEKMLHRTGAILSSGSVDEGSAQTDYLEVERARGISVKAAEAVLSHKGVRINIIDTPGHMDFMAEVERGLSAVDCALIIISAAEGVQPQAEAYFRAVSAMGLPAMFFINKIDRAGCSPQAVLEEIKAVLTPDVIALNRPLSPGSRGCGAEAAGLSEDDMLALCGRDDELEQAFLQGLDIDAGQLGAALARQTAAGRVYPAVFGAAALGVGIDALLDAIIANMPPATREEGPPAGRVYRVEYDGRGEKIAHVRLFCGSLKNRDTVAISGPGLGVREEKITQIRRASGRKQEDIGAFSAGDIAAVLGLASARTGDVIGRDLRREAEKIAVPLFSVMVSDGGQNPAQLLRAISQLAEEDPMLDYEWEPDQRELYINVMGKIQLEVLHHLLLQRYDIDAVFSPPTVIYRETPAGPGVGFEAYTMPKPCWAVIELQIEPLPRGAGFAFESTVRDEQIFAKYQSHILQSMPGALKQGLLGWPVTDLKITLVGGEHHVLHTHPLDFFLATPMAVMNGLERCGTLLLEPMQKARITAPEEYAGKIIGDIVNMRGRMDSPVTAAGRVTVEAVLPVAEAMDYPVRLLSQTAGRGRIFTEFGGFCQCPVELGKTAKRRGVDPRDRAKWILHKRSAL